MTQKISKETKKALSFLQEFVAFIKGFGVIGLALGVVIGSATNDLVKSLTTNIISPIIGLLLPSDSLANWSIGEIGIGLFLDSLINFTILIFVIWMSVKLVIAKMLSESEKEKIGIK